MATKVQEEVVLAGGWVQGLLGIHGGRGFISMGEPRGSVSGSRLFSASQMEACLFRRHSARVRSSRSGLPFLDERQRIQMATSPRDPTGFWVINSNASMGQMGAMDRRFWTLWPTRDTKESHTLNGGSVLLDFSSFQGEAKNQDL